MFAVSFGIYILIMIGIWGFFLVAKVHFFKFREYSQYMVKATQFLMFSLLFLTVLGAYFVYNLSGGPEPATQTVEESKENEVY